MVPKGWIELTQLDGNKLTISIQQIVCVRSPRKGEFDAAAEGVVAAAAQSVVEFASGKLQAISEARDAVIQQIAGQTAVT